MASKASIGVLGFAVAVAGRPLRLWIMPNGADPRSVAEERTRAFTRETGLPVQVEVLEWDHARARLDSGLSLRSGGPDVVQLGTSWVSDYASRGLLAPLDRQLPQLRPERFLVTSLATTRIDGSDTLWAVPWFVDVRVLLGNRRILDSLEVRNVDLADWQKFRATLRRIRTAGLRTADGVPIQPFGFPGANDWNVPHNFAPWIWSEGGDFVRKDADGRWESFLLDRTTVRGIRRYMEFVPDSLVDPALLSRNTAEVARAFCAGTQAFVVSTSELVRKIRIQGDSGGLLESPIGKAGIRAFPLPIGEAGSVAFVGGSDLCLPASRKSDPDALRLLLFLTRADNMDLYARRIGFLPADKEVLKDWAKDPTDRVLIQAADRGRAYPTIPRWSAIESELTGLFRDIWSRTARSGGCSGDELWTLLVRSDARIDSILGVEPRPMPLDSFRTMLSEMDDRPEPDSSSEILWGGGIGGAALGLAGLAWLRFRRRRDPRRPPETQGT
jgi:multiple sugar transport system substrate-binding protein